MQYGHNNSMKTFVIIWAGQIVSLLGTKMTRFALIIWAYGQTGNATTLALLGFFGFVPYVLVSPLAGVWVDRLDRRRVMLLADLGAGLTTLALLALYATGDLHIWHLYVAEALTGIFDAFQVPAYTAATSLLVPKRHYDRASGMRSLALSTADILAPAFAGLLLGVVGLAGVMLVDVVTFLAAVGTLAFVRIPAPPVTEDSPEDGESVWQQMAFGFRYIRARGGLLGLLLIFTGVNLFAALTYFGVLPAMILARTGGDQLALAAVHGALGLGGVIGGLVVSVGGLPRRRIHAALGATAISFLGGDFLFAVGQSTAVWALAGLVGAFFIPILISGDRAIWQAKVPPAAQGRVFSVQGMARNAMTPIGYLLAGPLADRVFEPAMMPGGALADVFGGLVGTGPGAGMGLMFVCTALLGMLVSASGYLIPAVRNVERDLPDYDDSSAAPEPVPTGPLAEAVSA